MHRRAIRGIRQVALASVAVVAAVAGVLVDAGPVAGAPLGPVSEPAIAAAGTRALVVWTEFAPGGDRVLARRVGPDGAPLGGPVVLRAAADGELLSEPDVAANHRVFAITWVVRREGSTAVELVRASLDGEPLDPQPLVVAASDEDQLAPAVAEDGGNFLLAWSRSSGAAGYDVAGRIADGDGAFQGPAFPVAALGSEDEPANELHPAVASTEGSWLVVWQQDVALEPGDCNGELDDEIACDLRASRVSAGGSVLDRAGMRLADGPADEYDAAVAGTGPAAEALVVWADERTGTPQLAGTALAQTAPRQPGGALVWPSAGLTRPAVAWNGKELGMVAVDGGGVRAARFSRHGRRLGGPVTLAAGGTAADLVPVNGHFVVAWTDGDAVATTTVNAGSLALGPTAVLTGS